MGRAAQIAPAKEQLELTESSMSSTRDAVSSFKERPSDTWELYDVPSCWNQPWLWFLLGFDPGRRCWGARAYDLGFFVKERRDWFEPQEHAIDHHDHEPDTWWNLPWYARPKLRHLWGQPQQPLHTGAEDLFLDLIFQLFD